MAINKRKNTRSQIWPDTTAMVKVVEDYGGGSRAHLAISGKVQNLGSNGFFIETEELVQVPAKAEIVIDFDPQSDSPAFKIQASGRTVHVSKGGIGIRFTSIDLNKLQKCIIAKMNKLEEESKESIKAAE
jgi:hypothetical protein